jgi:hypothetical protein
VLIKKIAFILAASFLYFPFANADELDTKNGPPGSHVRSATINLEQGGTIYANGKMQATIRMGYELSDGVTLNRYILRRAWTDQDINISGWGTSSIDNGFDKNIQNYYDESFFESPSEKSQSGNYKTIYVTADRSNANSSLNMCLVLYTTKSQSEQIYSTCYDESIVDGMVTISAIHPIIYSANDFEIKYQKQIRGNFYEKIQLFSLDKKPQISDTLFTVNTDNLVFNTSSELRPHSFNATLLDTSVHSNIMSQAMNLLTKHDSEVEFKWVTSIDNPRVDGFTIEASYDPNTMFNLVNVILNQREFIAIDRRCRPNGVKNRYDCIAAYNLTPWVSWNETAHIPDQLSKEITMSDNYGNDAKLLLYYIDNEYGMPRIR